MKNMVGWLVGWLHRTTVRRPAVAHRGWCGVVSNDPREGGWWSAPHHRQEARGGPQRVVRCSVQRSKRGWVVECTAPPSGGSTGALREVQYNSHLLRSESVTYDIMRASQTRHSIIVHKQQI